MLRNINLADLLYMVPVIILSFTIHEFAHAFMAVKSGDTTPKELGRYTLNPLVHVSWVGLVLLILAGFGWAKPVIYNRNNLKNPKVDSVMIALAGPLSNLVTAFLFAIIHKVLVVLGVPWSPGISIYVIVRYFILINSVLFVFNMLPIPPLDGSHVLVNLLPDSLAVFKAYYLRYGNVLFLLLIVLSFSGFNVFGTMILKTYSGIMRIFGLI